MIFLIAASKLKQFELREKTKKIHIRETLYLSTLVGKNTYTKKILIIIMCHISPVTCHQQQKSKNLPC